MGAVKNPEAPSAPGTGLDETRRATFPKKLRERFAGRRFIPAEPPDFLDYEWAETSSSAHARIFLRNWVSSSFNRLPTRDDIEFE